MEFETKEFILEGTEFIGIKPGQDYYKLIKNELISGINKIIIPAECEFLASWVRGFMGQRDEDCYVSFCSDNKEIQETARKWQKEFAGIHGDKDATQFVDKKKKKK